MALCGGCGESSSRIRTILTDDKGNLLEKPIEFCKLCRPEEFEGWKDPSNKHGGFRWQYEPQKYKKRTLDNGMIKYEAKDERNADLEQQIADGGKDERQKYAAALEKRRRENANKRKSLTKAEIESAVSNLRPKFERIALERKWNIQ